MHQITYRILKKFPGVIYPRTPIPYWESAKVATLTLRRCRHRVKLINGSGNVVADGGARQHAADEKKCGQKVRTHRDVCKTRPSCNG